MYEFIKESATILCKNGLKAEDVKKYLMKKGWTEWVKVGDDQCMFFKSKEIQASLTVSDERLDSETLIKDIIPLSAYVQKCSPDSVAYGLFWQLFLRRSKEIMEGNSNENN